MYYIRALNPFYSRTVRQPIINENHTGTKRVNSMNVEWMMRKAGWMVDGRTAMDDTQTRVVLYCTGTCLAL